MKLIKSGYISVRKIKYNPKYKKYSLRISQVEEDLIAADLKKNGQQDSIKLDENGDVVDGHLRIKLLGTSAAIEIRFAQYKFVDEVEKITFILSLNRMRRHYSEYQKCLMALPYYKEEKKKAEKRQKSGKTLRSQDRKGEATFLAAQAAGTSGSTFKRFLEIERDGSEEQKKKLAAGDARIKTVANQLKIKNRVVTHVEIPKGEYNVLEIDFPWGYDNENVGSAGGASANNKYPTLSPKDILAIEVPKFKKIVAKDAVLFMWVTTPLLSEIIQLKILEELGFKYKTMITWHKIIPDWYFGGNALGFWYKIETEHCLVGIKGKVTPFRSDLPNFIETDMLKHSEKPIEFKELFEESTKYIPGRKMFEGYQRRPRKGWTGYGNEMKGPLK